MWTSLHSSKVAIADMTRSTANRPKSTLEAQGMGGKTISHYAILRERFRMARVEGRWRARGGGVNWPEGGLT